MKVQTRSGVVHFGEQGSRYMVMPHCGPRSRQTVGHVTADTMPITCKACIKKESNG